MSAPCGKAESCEKCPFPDCNWDGVSAEEWANSKHLDSDSRHANESKVAAQQRAYYEANREKIAAKRRAYYEANREKVAAQQRAYREANREKVAAQQRAYREANREKVAAQQRAYYEANREKINQYRRDWHKKHKLTKNKCEEGAPMTYFIAAVKARGMKLKYLAERLGLSRTALSKRIHGRTPWTLPEVQQACKVLGMSLDTFSGFFPLEG